MKNCIVCEKETIGNFGGHPVCLECYESGKVMAHIYRNHLHIISWCKCQVCVCCKTPSCNYVHQRIGTDYPITYKEQDSKLYCPTCYSFIFE